MAAELSKTVRITDDVKVEVYKEGKRKFTKIWEPNYDTYIKGSTMDRSMSDDDVIIESIKLFAIQIKKKDQDYYKVIQDPWNDTPPTKRKYGSTPYYLNNGCKILIQWFNAGFVAISDNDDADGLINKNMSLYMPSGFTENNGVGYIMIDKTTNKLDYSTKIGPNDFEYPGTYKDSDIIYQIIQKYKSSLIELIGDNDYQLELCDPDTESCSIIPYKSPISAPSPTTIGATSSTQTAKKIQLTLVGISDIIEVKAKQNLPDFKVYIGDPPKTGDDIDEYDASDEYSESEFSGSEEESWAPDPNAVEDSFDGDTEKGSFEGDAIIEESLPATANQKDFIRVAVKSTLANGETHGLCAKGTFNIANNYIRLLQGKTSERGMKYSAGGNANVDGYHENLQKIGYKKYDRGETSKISLISGIGSFAWEIGDILIYWCVDGPRDASHVKYGHTQIFTNGEQGTGYKWSTDNINNYNASFVYGRKSGDTWHWMIFKAPKTNRLNPPV